MQDLDERDHVAMLNTFIRDRIDGHRGPPGILFNCLFDANDDYVPFLTWSRVCEMLLSLR